MRIFNRGGEIQREAPLTIYDVKARVVSKRLSSDNNFLICEIMIKKDDDDLFNIGEIFYINKKIPQENQIIERVVQKRERSSYLTLYI
jgi:hypothetical protein